VVQLCSVFFAGFFLGGVGILDLSDQARDYPIEVVPRFALWAMQKVSGPGDVFWLDLAPFTILSCSISYGFLFLSTRLTMSKLLSSPHLVLA